MQDVFFDRGQFDPTSESLELFTIVHSINDVEIASFMELSTGSIFANTSTVYQHRSSEGI